jgi:hypothetical protein
VKGIVILLLILAGYTLIYAGISKITKGLTFFESAGGSVPAPATPGGTGG